MKPFVSIGVCVKNSSSTLRDAIESIINQDFVHELMEVIFVDDGSEDNTLSIIEECVSRIDIPVRIFHNNWQGLGPVRNIVVDNAQGKYIIWVDGDMTLPEDHVRKQVEFMEHNPDVGIAAAKYYVLSEEKAVAALEKIPLIMHNSTDEESNTRLPGTGGSIYRVKAIKQVGGFDSNMRSAGEDQDAAHRIKSRGWRIAKSPAVFCEKPPQTWKKVWDKNFWYGYGNYTLFRKNRSVFSLYKMNPVAGFFVGAIHAVNAYKMLHENYILLLPLHYVFRMSAWVLGFIKAQLGY